MFFHPIALNRRGLRHAGIRLAQAAALALAVTLALPTRAADERPVRSRVAPVYPELAKRMRVTGIVKVEATVDTSGKVTAVKTLSGSRVLSTAAEDAVSRWKFAPGADQATVDVDVNFSLSE